MSELRSVVKTSFIHFRTFTRLFAPLPHHVRFDLFLRCGFEPSPDTQHVPDHHGGVEAVQAQSHPGRRDAIGQVQHVGGQRTGLCCCSHDLLEQPARRFVLP